MAAQQLNVQAEATRTCDDAVDNCNESGSELHHSKVKRPAPQVPIRDPRTALSSSTPTPMTEKAKPRTNVGRQLPLVKKKKPLKAKAAPSRQSTMTATETAHANPTSHETVIESNNNNEDNEIIKNTTNSEQEQGNDQSNAHQQSRYVEEPIYQPIWQFQTIGAAPPNDADADDDDNEAEFEIITPVDAANGIASADSDDDDDDDDAATVLQSAAAFAAGARQRGARASPLPSPTISTDQGAWETDDEFMFATQRQTEELQPCNADAFSMGSTVTNSMTTLSSQSSRSQDSASSSSTHVHISLTHSTLRNVCIFYSIVDPKKYSTIFYDYQRDFVYKHFMTRVRRPPYPMPTTAPACNDDSGYGCDGRSLEDKVLLLPAGEAASCNDPAIPQPMKEVWALAVLAATGAKRGAAARPGRKLRVRSNAHLLIPLSVMAWRELLQDADYCEDEEDLIVPVTDILRAQQIKEDNEVQQTQQTNILQRFKSASIGNLVDLPGEDDKKSIKDRMRLKLNSNVFRINRSPKSEKKTRSRRGLVNSLYLDEQSKYPLFAAPLNALELNMTNHPNVPRFVVDICAYIERPDCIGQDGLYRASGNKLLVDDLKRKLTHLYDPRWLQTDDIHTLTSLHKQFFRELATPLITQEAYESLDRNLLDAAAIERMKVAFDEMPEPNRSTLRFLIKHLTSVAAASASNRMPASNLAIVWGPCLLAANQIQFDIGRMNMLAKVLIENYERIFRPDNERLVC